jgi:hypothetical protein
MINDASNVWYCEGSSEQEQKKKYSLIALIIFWQKSYDLSGRTNSDYRVRRHVHEKWVEHQINITK